MTLKLQNKIIFASVNRSQLDVNLKDYLCDLVIEEDIEKARSKKYLQFKHKNNKEPPFKIILSKFKRPSNLMHVYKLENQKFSLKGVVERVAESIVEKQSKPRVFKQIGDDQDWDFFGKRLIFEKQSSAQKSDSDDYSDSSYSSIGLAPANEESKSKVKTAIIEILNKRGKVSSIKDLNLELKKTHKIKIPESSAKELALKVCIVDKKTKGFVLRPEYTDNDEKLQGKKKVKIDSY